MQIRTYINGKEIRDAAIRQWELTRARAVYRYLRAGLGEAEIKRMAGNTPTEASGFLNAVQALQEQLGEDRIRRLLKRDLARSERLTRMMCALSFGRRRHCIIEMSVEGITAASFMAYADEIMTSPEPGHAKFCLNACPDHYLLQGAGNNAMEVIETTGGAPFPAQFFLVMGDEQGLTLPADPAYPLQMAGIGRLKDGKAVGGIRHQFQEQGNGFRARFGVEFPGMIPAYFVSQHQMHLACEWSNWVRMAVAQQQTENP